MISRLICGALVIMEASLLIQAMENDSIRLPIRITIENKSNEIYTYSVFDKKNEIISPGESIHYHKNIAIPFQKSEIMSFTDKYLCKRLMEFIFYQHKTEKVESYLCIGDKTTLPQGWWQELRNECIQSFTFYTASWLIKEDDRGKFLPILIKIDLRNSVNPKHIDYKLNIFKTNAYIKLTEIPDDDDLFSFDKIVTNDLDAFKKDFIAKKAAKQETFLNSARPLRGYKDGHNRSMPIEYQCDSVNNLALVETAIAQCRRNIEPSWHKKIVTFLTHVFLGGSG